MKEKVAGFSFLWICFWSMAVDGPNGLIAVALVMLGTLVLGGILLSEIKKEKEV